MSCLNIPFHSCTVSFLENNVRCDPHIVRDIWYSHQVNLCCIGICKINCLFVVKLQEWILFYRSPPDNDEAIVIQLYGTVQPT